MDDDTLQMTMLFDFFGDLLTEKQREYFDLYHNEDLSLSEIAERTGISRQGAFDIIKRAEKTLLEIEDKTGIVKKWQENRVQMEQAEVLVRELLTCVGNDCKAVEITRELLLVLESL